MNPQSNTWKFHIYKVLWGLGLGLAFPVFVLYFQGRGLLLAEFMVLMSVMNISLFALEVPTGIVADKFSRKWSVCSGTLVMGSSVGVMIVAAQYPLLVFAFGLWGLGEALVSGADSALLYDSLKVGRREGGFQKVIGTAVSLQLAGVVGGSVLCGLVVDRFGLAAPLWASFGALVLAGVVAALFGEPPFLEDDRAAGEIRSFGTRLSSYIGHLRESFRFVIGSRELVVLVFVNIVVLRLCFLVERPFAQPYLASFDYDPQQISFFHTLFYGATALAARSAHRVAGLLGGRERNVLLLVGLLGVLFLLLMVSADIGRVAVGAMTGIYLMKGLFEPLMQDSLNRRLTSAKRASCLSIAKMGNNFVGMALGPLFGYLADALTLHSSLRIFQGTFVVLLSACMVAGWVVLGGRGGMPGGGGRTGKAASHAERG